MLDFLGKGSVARGAGSALFWDLLAQSIQSNEGRTSMQVHTSVGVLRTFGRLGLLIGVKRDGSWKSAMIVKLTCLMIFSNLPLEVVVIYEILEDHYDLGSVC